MSPANELCIILGGEKTSSFSKRPGVSAKGRQHLRELTQQIITLIRPTCRGTKNPTPFVERTPSIFPL